jgi:hypothetical protein
MRLAEAADPAGGFRDRSDVGRRPAFDGAEAVRRIPPRTGVGVVRAHPYSRRFRRT